MPSANPRKTRHAATRQTRQPRVPAWVWLFTGGVLGAFIMFLMRLSEVESPEKTAQSKPTIAKTAAPAKPRLDFYELLKETTVNVPEPLTSGEKNSAAEANFEYMLQAASFHRKKDAEHLRAELILLNMNADIEQVTVNGKAWHRVLVGPFVSRSKLAQARSTLVSNNINPLTQKRPKPRAG